MVPARFRDHMVPDGAFVMQGFDQNLMVLPSDKYQELARRVNQMSLTDSRARLLKRQVFSTADHVDVDKAGRILLPQFLRKFAGLEDETVVIGMGEFFEIWSPEAWSDQNAELQNAQANPDRFSALDLAFA